MSAQPHTTMTPEEYLAFEERSTDKYEYYGGIIVALAGGNQAHSIICSNLNAILHSQLRKRPCTVYTSDMKVKAERPRKYMYPDLSIACGQSIFEDSSRRVLLNPTIVIEVLSESTEKHDRGKKFQYYRSIESVQEYVLVAQDTKHIDHYQRQSDNLWLFSESKSFGKWVGFSVGASPTPPFPTHLGSLLSSVDIEDERLFLPSVDCTLVIEDVYEKVSFDADIDPSLDYD